MIIPIDIFKKVIPILQKRIYTIREFFSAQALLVTLKRAKADATPPEGGAGFWAAKAGPRQRRRGVFQSPRRSSPLHFPLRNRLPAPSACRFSRLNIALYKGISFHKPGQASTAVRVEPRPGKKHRPAIRVNLFIQETKW
jgi:hypothetical protein